MDESESQKMLKIILDALRGMSMALISGPGVDIKNFSDGLTVMGSADGIDPQAQQMLRILGKELAQLVPSEKR